MYNINLIIFGIIVVLNLLSIITVLYRSKNHLSQDKLTELNNQLTRYQVENEHLLKQNEELNKNVEVQVARREEAKQAILDITGERNSLLIQVERLTIENRNLKDAYNQFENVLTKLRQDLNQEFTNLKNQAVNDLKIEASSSLRSIGKDELVVPLDKILRQLQADIIALQTETRAMNQSSTGLNITAKNLAEALTKDSKKKGDFGEMILSNILESVGLHDKISYLEQEQITYDGERHVPDIVINLPDNRALIIDSKNIIGGYYQNIVNEEDTNTSTHKALDLAIKDLSSKKYVEALEHKLGKQVFEYIILFIPNEGLFNQILQDEGQNQHNLISEAYAKKIIIAGPSTVLLLVAIIDKMWRTAKADEIASQIIKLATELCAKFKTTLDNMAKLGNSLKSSVNGYNDLIGSFDNGDTKSAIGKISTLVGYNDLPKSRDYLKTEIRMPASLGEQTLNDAK